MLGLITAILIIINNIDGLEEKDINRKRNKVRAVIINKDKKMTVNIIQIGRWYPVTISPAKARIMKNSAMPIMSIMAFFFRNKE